MIQNRNFLFGLGTGLIATSIVYGVSDLVRSQPAVIPQPSPATTSAKSVDNHAAGRENSNANNQPSSANQQTAVPQPQAPAAAPSSAKVKVEIKKGMTAAEIADLLVKSGVIADANAFLNTAQEKVKQIRVGVYELPVNGDYQQILAIITKDA
ncbi:MltG/YceG/YrrL family protein [Effusibacillus pohliae]|uniref:endolytic transglycosylase MltG n=1 Tax=Effusibacillus pohliae TaxID=232270 RepID=UPI00037B0513|nr:endolytic transglycosylase MltG [Effusibacillus pohliae]